MLQREPATAAQEPGLVANAPMPAAVPPRKNYVFIMGSTKNDNFYAAATAFFKQHEKGAEIVRDKRTLAQIIEHVNAGGVPALNIVIVSHANEEGNLGFSLDAADLRKDASKGDKKPRTEFDELKSANDQGGLPAADSALIDSVTKIRIKGCNIGRSQLMLDQLDTAFGGHAEVVAPTHKQVYDTRGKVPAEAFEPYFVEAPGKVAALGLPELETLFRNRYPAVPEAKWPKLLRKIERAHIKRPSYVWSGINPPQDDEKDVMAHLRVMQKLLAGKDWQYIYKGRTVVDDNYQYELRAERINKDGSTEFQDLTYTVSVPPEPSNLIAQEQAKSGRPDAYVWSVADEVKGTTLIRRVLQERTEWTINARIVDAAGIANPNEADKSFYGHSQAPAPPHPSAP